MTLWRGTEASGAMPAQYEVFPAVDPGMPGEVAVLEDITIRAEPGPGQLRAVSAT